MPATPACPPLLLPPPRPAGDSKTQALLHGHSYTAHPLGCSAAVEALALYEDPSLNPNLICQRSPVPPAACSAPAVAATEAAAGLEGQGSGVAAGGRLRPLWDEGRAAQLSRHPRVEGVVVLGE